MIPFYFAEEGCGGDAGEVSKAASQHSKNETCSAWRHLRLDSSLKFKRTPDLQINEE
jgi:hypothetical protein